MEPRRSRGIGDRAVRTCGGPGSGAARSTAAARSTTASPLAVGVRPSPATGTLGIGTLAAGLCLAGLLASPLAAPLAAQERDAAAPRGSGNIEVVARVPLEGGKANTADIELEQDLSRPFAYVSRARYNQPGVMGIDVIDLRDPENASLLLEWRMEQAELHQGPGPLDPKVFTWNGRNYLVQSFQFGRGGPDHDLGAIVFDVTGLPDPAEFNEVARIRDAENPGGFHNIYVYRHSDGRVYLVTTVRAPHANVYDLGTVVEEGPDEALVATIPIPESAEGAGALRGYHDMYVAYHHGSGQDRFYGGGTGGYYVYDVSDLQAPRLLTSMTGISGVRGGHTIQADPTGRYVITETEYQYAPLRIFDIQPGLDGEVATVSQPIAAWTADWRNLPHNQEMRWPYVFVSAYEDGLQVVNMMDPEDPYTAAYYDTYDGPHGPEFGGCGGNVCVGAFGVDVRNADGLIVISDDTTGFWAFRMVGFPGWNGNSYGVPDVSSAQDWEDGPVR